MLVAPTRLSLYTYNRIEIGLFKAKKATVVRLRLPYYNFRLNQK